MKVLRSNLNNLNTDIKLMVVRGGTLFSSTLTVSFFNPFFGVGNKYLSYEPFGNCRLTDTLLQCMSKINHVL